MKKLLTSTLVLLPFVFFAQAQVFQGVEYSQDSVLHARFSDSIYLKEVDVLQYQINLNNTNKNIVVKLRELEQQIRNLQKTYTLNEETLIELVKAQKELNETN